VRRLSYCGCVLIALAMGWATALTTTVAFASETRLPLPSSLIQEFALSIAPGALAVGPEKSLWFTASGEVARVTTKGVITGEFVVPTGTQSDMPFGYSDPAAIALGPDDNMWFTDEGESNEHENLIGRVTPVGKIVEFPFVTAGVEGSGHLDSIVKGADGDMWFTDVIYHTHYDAHGFIGRVSPDGAITTYAIPTGNAVNLPEQSIPAGIAQGPDGNMWFTDQGGNYENRPLIGRISPSGEITEFPVPELIPEFPIRHVVGLPMGIVQGSDGAMWFRLGASAIGRVTPTGSITEYGLGIRSLGPITPGPEGDIWIGDEENEVGRVASTGSVAIFSPASGNGRYIRSLIQGPEGDLWYLADNELGQLALVHLSTPFAPVVTIAPTISGKAVEGDILTVSNGSWLHESSMFTYQWQQCNSAGAQCEDLTGAASSSMVLTDVEVGHTLRAVVTAMGIGGSTSSVSSASPVVQALSPAPVPAQKVLATVAVGKTRPSVGSSMTWRFDWKRHFTVVKALVVHGVPAGGWIEVSCRGAGCPIGHVRPVGSNSVPLAKCRRRKCRPSGLMHTGEFELAKMFGARHLATGVHITVDIHKLGWIGRFFAFIVRANNPPRVEVGCLAADSLNTVNKC
jgi:streptogramin lyase